MTTLAAAPRPSALLGAAGAGLGLLALVGCSASPSADTSAAYRDGTYTAEGGYVSPGGQQTVRVELTLRDDIVTAVTVTPEADDPQALGFQQKFAGGIAELVVGKDIDSLEVSRVAGSSLTSGGFTAAVDAIKAEALEG